MNSTVFFNPDPRLFAETCVKEILDVSLEKEVVLSFTSQDSYKKKIELIYTAEDMTTAEKLEALNMVEERRAKDIQNGVEACRDLLWNRSLLVFSCITGIALLVTTPEGSKTIKSVLKRVA